MRNELFNQMLSAYDLTTEQQKLNATFEVNQQIILAGLYNGGFFNEAAFYGGTCLRIFHGLQRFSEDMDFSLLAPNDKFDFTNFFQPIIDQFAMVGRNIEIKKKDKKNDARSRLPNMEKSRQRKRLQHPTLFHPSARKGLAVQS